MILNSFNLDVFFKHVCLINKYLNYIGVDQGVGGGSLRIVVIKLVQHIFLNFIKGIFRVAIPYFLLVLILIRS